MNNLINSKYMQLNRRSFLKANMLTATGLAVTSLAGTSAQAGALAEKPHFENENEISKLRRVKQELVAPPFMPEHEQVTSSGPKVVEVRLEIEEKLIDVDNTGAKIWAFTYNGSVPGPMIVVHQGDYVEVALANLKTNQLGHNVDFHASTGAMGGGALTEVGPGNEVVLRFKAIKPGVFIYHCAPGGVMTPWHIVHGMNGALMVLPRDGLKDKQGNSISYDRAYYIGEQDYYIKQDENGQYKNYDSPTASLVDDIEVMKTLIPSHIVFNGKIGALTGDNAMTARVGETVLFIHSQANYDTRPHLIGGHGDYVWQSGSFSDDPETGLETWFIRGGSAGAAIYTFRQPGVYAYVNHNLIEAVIKGAVAHVKVDGDWNDSLMKQIIKPRPIVA